MHIEPLLSAIGARYKSVRSGLDVGFGDEGASAAFASCRGGEWRTLGGVDRFPYADSQFQVVVLAPSAVTKELVREANRVLQPEGSLFFTVAERRVGTEGFSAPEIYKLVREGFDIVSLNKPRWWRFGRERGTVTVCARKKAWRERRSFSRGGSFPLSPFANGSSSALAAAALLLFSAFPASAATVGKAAEKRERAIISLLDSRAAASTVKYEEAAKIVAEDAALGKPLQQFVIALVAAEPFAPDAARRIGDAKRKEYLARSREKIRALAEKSGNALAWYLLSIENNDRKMLKRAAEGENVQAMNAWGTIQLAEALSNPGIATNDVERILRKSFGFFKKAAEKKDPNGFYNLGMCYMNGYGVAQDVDMAYDSFKFAADAGHPEAMNNLGGFFRDGIVVEKDVRAATRWFKRSADLGNPYGQLNYGLALQRGEGVDADVKAAAALFKAAAEQGNAEAMDAYGMCFYRGEGVKKNDRLAVRWYKRSASLGCAHAMENLAFCSAMGIGGMTPDQEEATVWKVRARAARGDSNAVAWLRQNGHAIR